MYPKSEKQLSKEDKDARKFIVRNVADDLFSLVQGPRSQYYGVLGHERRKARNIYPWLTDGMLDHQLKKLKKIQKRGVAFGALQANTTVDPLLICDLQSIASDAARTAGRPAGSTTDASKTLDDRKRKAFDDAATIYSKLKMTMKQLPRAGLKQIIERAKVENGLEKEENWTISANSVRSRYKGNVNSSEVVKRGWACVALSRCGTTAS
jgi:hypothetical protein